MEVFPVTPEALLGQISELLKKIVGTNIEVAGYRVANQKYNYRVILLQLRNPSLELVLKLAGPGTAMSCQFEQTAWLYHRLVTETTLFVPTIIAIDTSYQNWPWRYLIRTYVAGEEWAEIREHLNAEEYASAHVQFGDAVAQLHNIRFPAFGEFRFDGQVDKGKSFLQALRERAERRIKNEQLRAHLFSVMDEHATLFVELEEASLCHDDLHGHNILFRKVQDQWQLATILDFDKAWAGYPETDLARLEFWRGMTSRSFWQAYSVRRTVSPTFFLRRRIYQLMWCFEHAKNTDIHLFETNALCSRFGLPRLERFS